MDCRASNARTDAASIGRLPNSRVREVNFEGQVVWTLPRTGPSKDGLALFTPLGLVAGRTYARGGLLHSRVERRRTHSYAPRGKGPIDRFRERATDE